MQLSYLLVDKIYISSGTQPSTNWNEEIFTYIYQYLITS